jgi:hypothetical protein
VSDAERPSIYDLSLTVMCARCEARPGDDCRTITGRKASIPHSARQSVVHEAFAVGFIEGALDGIDLVTSYIERELRRTEDGSGRGDLSTAVQVALKLARRQYATT